VLIIL